MPPRRPPQIGIDTMAGSKHSHPRNDFTDRPSDARRASRAIGIASRPAENVEVVRVRTTTPTGSPRIGRGWPI